MNLLTKNRANAYICYLLNNKLIDITTYLEYQWIIEKESNIDLERFFSYCVINSGLEYKNFPAGFKSSTKFISTVAKERPMILEEVSKKNKQLFNQVVVSLNGSDLNKFSKLLRRQSYNKIEQIKNEL